MKHIIALLTLLICIFPASAEDEERWYQIELIVYENTDSSALNSEIWPDDPGTYDAENMVELSYPTPTETVANEMTIDNAFVSDQPVPFQLLHWNEFILTPIEKKLNRSGKYHPLLHIAWRQSFGSKDEATAVHITSAINRIQQNTVNPTGQAVQYQESMEKLDGVIKITLGRYLHTEADLIYRIPDVSMFGSHDFIDDDTTATIVRMTQSRRMRSGELHYFDHPLFGLLVQITPFEHTDKIIDDVDIIPLESTGGG